MCEKTLVLSWRRASLPELRLPSSGSLRVRSPAGMASAKGMSEFRTITLLPKLSQTRGHV